MVSGGTLRHSGGIQRACLLLKEVNVCFWVHPAVVLRYVV
jgi:hypothetical protein